jgi:hypothetical protein
VYKKLRAELEDTLPNSHDPVYLRVVEQLPYFACLNASKMRSNWLTNDFRCVLRCSMRNFMSSPILTFSSLAKAELRFAIATVIRRFNNQELFEMARFDVDINKHDLFLPQADFKSKGVRKQQAGDNAP